MIALLLHRATRCTVMTSSSAVSCIARGQRGGPGSRVPGIQSRCDVLVLDGGTGEELLSHRGVEDDRTTWSALAVSENKYHDELCQVHEDFLRSGSDVITCNNFGITPGVFGFDDSSIERIRKLTRQAGEIANRAVHNVHGGTGSSKHPSGNNGQTTKLVLGSLPPLVESYRPDLALEDADHAMRLYRTCIIDVLDDMVDGWIAETLSSSDEVMVAIDALAAHYREQLQTRCIGDEQEDRASTRRPKQLLVSMCVKREGRIRSGETASEAVRRVVQHWISPATSLSAECICLRGVLFNCSRPEDIESALEDVCRDSDLLALLDEHDVSLGAYPNRLTEIQDGWSMEGSTEPQGTRTDLDEDTFVAWTQKVMERYGRVRIVGGCCGIRPSFIEALKDALTTFPEYRRVDTRSCSVGCSVSE
jgi:S-methylmethionine-dependent homocysteine/selenocysteine methylase